MDTSSPEIDHKPVRILRVYLTAACGFFALLGATLAFFGDSPIFEIYSRHMRDVFFSGEKIPEAVNQFRLFTYGQLGGTIAGRWVMLALICLHGLKRNETWVPGALLASIFSWFIIDSAVSIYYGALFNVWLINIMPVILVALPTLLLFRVRPVPMPRPREGESDREFIFWYRWMLAASLLPALQGVLTAVFASPDPMGIYTNRVAEFFWNGAIPPNEEFFRRFLLGPLGGVLTGYFVAQYFLVRYAWKEKAKWGRDAIAAGLLVWFCLDSTVSIMHGAWFNLYLVNVPTLIAIAMPMLVTRKYFT